MQRQRKGFDAEEAKLGDTGGRKGRGEVAGGGGGAFQAQQPLLHEIVVPDLLLPLLHDMVDANADEEEGVQCSRGQGGRHRG